MTECHYFECACFDADHIIRVAPGRDICSSLEPSVFVEVQMSPAAPWYARVWRGLLYMFGVQRQHWAEAILERPNLERLRDLLTAELEAFPTAKETGQ